MKYFILIILLTASISFARDTVGNGGGRAEKNILFAYTRLESFIELCFFSESCTLTQREGALLSQIFNTLYQEKLNKNQIQFVSEKENPGFFNEGEEGRIAKTGSKVSSTIYINTDLLYSKNSQGFLEALSISKAVALLIHELGHHNGDYSHLELDVLGVKVASILELQTYTTPAIPWNDNVYAVVMNSKNIKVKTSLIVYVFEEITDLSAELQEAVTCPSKSKPQGIMLYNLHWMTYSPTSEGNGNYGIQSNAVLACETGEKVTQIDGGLITLTFSVAKENMVPGSFKIVQQ